MKQKRHRRVQCMCPVSSATAPESAGGALSRGLFGSIKEYGIGFVSAAFAGTRERVELVITFDWGLHDNTSCSNGFSFPDQGINQWTLIIGPTVARQQRDFVVRPASEFVRALKDFQRGVELARGAVEAND